MRTFFQALKVVSVITLTFFSWTYLPLYQIAAYAAQQKTDARTQRVEGSRRARPEPSEGLQPAQNLKPEERFEKALEEIREKVGRAEEKTAKNEDISTEIEAIKTKKTEIELLDVELRKELAATEKKNKDSNLSKEILDRHYKFVKNYEDNLAELKANIDGIEKAKTPAALKTEVAKAKRHLDKVIRPPRKHIVDPNKLPNGIVKAKERQPRVNKEEFEREFKTGKKGKKIANSWPKPILLAFNGPLTSLLSSNYEPEIRSSAVSSGSPFLQIAQASNSPDPADLAETLEIQFTPEIRAKAQELGNNPHKIYEWVRNNIEFAPTYGSIQGAQMCLQTRQCNAYDTASLLIALLRVSNVYAHYVYGTIEVPIQKVMNWVGGVTDPKMAATVLATNGIPARVLISGGMIKTVQLEHIWVEAWIDYFPSWGARHRPGGEDTWIPLDPSFKQYTYTQGIDIKTNVPFDAQTFVDQIKATATINETEGYVTNVNFSLIQQAMQDYQARVQNYITQNYPNATVGDVLGKKEIIKQEFPYLMGTLPYRTVQVGAEFTQIPNNLHASISFSIPDPMGVNNGLTYTTSLPQIAGKKITLSFSPATTTDETVIKSYIPANGLPSSLPAYLINLKPELRIDGQIAATGAPIMMGSELSFTISLNEPGIGPSQINNTVLAGEYNGIGLDTGKIGDGNLNAIKAKLENTKAKLDLQNYDDLTKDDLVGDILYATIASYFAELDMNDEITAKTIDVVRYRAPSIGMFSFALDVTGIFGIPTSAIPKGMMMDVDRIMQAVLSKDGNMDKVKQYMLSSGMNSSTLEHTVPERLYSQPTSPVNAISAVKALKLANDQGIPIYTINQSNISTVLPILQIGAETKSDIANAVNAGKTVIIPKASIVLNGWTGYGYIVTDTATGAGAYMISSGSSGAWVILGLISGTLALYGIILVVGFLFAAMSIIAAMIGAFLVGLAIGLILSQALSSEAKAELKNLFKSLLEKSIPILSASGFPIAAAVALVAWIIIKLLDLAEQVAIINWRRKNFCNTGIKLLSVEG